MLKGKVKVNERLNLHTYAPILDSDISRISCGMQREKSTFLYGFSTVDTPFVFCLVSFCSFILATIYMLT